MKHVLAPGLTLTFIALVGTAVVLAEEPAAYDFLALSDNPLGDETDFDTAPAIDDLSCIGTGSYSRPKWTVSAGAVFLHRNDPKSRTLLVDPEDGSELMNSLDLKPGWGAGPRFEITRHFCHDLDFEVEFFSIDNWANSADAQNASPSTGERFWDPYVFDDVQASYGTDLYSLELNVRRPLFGCRRLMGLAGFRYAQLNDGFFTRVSLTQDPFTVTNRGQLTLDNHLYGFQLGLEPVLWNPCGPLRVDGIIKAGVYGNDVDWLLTTGGDLNTRRWEKKGCRTSYITEMALKVTYDFCWCRCKKPSCCDPESCEPESCEAAVCTCRRWSLFAGYEAFWMCDVATAEQLKRRIRYDKAYYHGFVFGIEIPLGRQCCAPRQSCAPCTSSACE
ncbi:MAG: hypothetical protein ABIP48_31845 [Planctomycetota bacterium]